MTQLLDPKPPAGIHPEGTVVPPCGLLSRHMIMLTTECYLIQSVYLNCPPTAALPSVVKMTRYELIYRK